MQHNLQNTIYEHIDINQICFGKWVNRSVIIIYGSPQPEAII